MKMLKTLSIVMLISTSVLPEEFENFDAFGDKSLGDRSLGDRSPYIYVNPAPKPESPALKLVKRLIRIGIAAGVVKMMKSDNLKSLTESINNITPESGDNVFKEISRTLLCNLSALTGWTESKLKNDKSLSALGIKIGTGIGAYLVTDTNFNEINETIELPLKVITSTKVLLALAALVTAIHNFLPQQMAELYELLKKTKAKASPSEKDIEIRLGKILETEQPF